MGVAKHGNHSDKPVKINRKIDLLMGELRKYGVSVAGIQETKWFGKVVWPVGRYTFLHSGHPLPGDQERASRNEGVGIALDEKATVAWKNAGEVWEAVSSRIISARLKWVHTGKKKGGWSGKASGTYVSVVCAYEPTAKAHPSIKLKFYDDFQDTIDRIPHNDILVMLGDFNARVGVLDTGNNLWQGVIGKHGLSEHNFVGKEFLEFCALNQFSIMNTWFQKKKIYQGTWTHPATKKYHI